MVSAVVRVGLMMSGSSTQTFDAPKLEALVEMMFLAAYADGEFSEEERAHFVDSVESLTNKRLSGEDLEALLLRIEKAGGSDGRDARLASVKERLGDSGACKVALRLAVQVMAADGIIRTSERELIFDIALALDIDRDEAADIVRECSR